MSDLSILYSGACDDTVSVPSNPFTLVSAVLPMNSSEHSLVSYALLMNSADAKVEVNSRLETVQQEHAASGPDRDEAKRAADTRAQVAARPGHSPWCSKVIKCICLTPLLLATVVWLVTAAVGH